MLPKGLVRYWHIFLPLIFLGALLTPLALRSYVEIITQNRRYTNINQVPIKPVAIVFGAGVWEDGTPMPMLADRIQGAIDLYHLGRVEKILMTGDNATPEYNEVIAMQTYAQDQGIPLEDIKLDYAGFSTYESCYRAREIFGVERAVLITQQYHLPRAVYTCNQLGIDAVGYGTADWGRYQDEPMRFYTQREILAIIKALLDLHILHPKPTFLGPFEGM
ncbi:MAG: ElyC/SanA/YdcF family protein [Limnoraphis robusta]|uniref:Membrane protein n=2 Tax=Limnoraphis robusta TaxID=1118279 RepID=A0A0F5Y7V6_9CYAN|nr:ElyC/SanA/YdcF family protein [Limnoraphis robusta]KKD35026.1 membrane protein [Limnoraphis robusta CS-951]MEA5500964.1 ElyC/SanA/YdcF family protein [Limnoraphis robusta BA-68 BA1]MEA5523216.1 ElyC/SanA/YdcF family protein [Limnoraphis robusta CCNP1315]MEA5539943.1 ElyC/SanA/YdcF family protein [Limnoraphis robusta Tam1]MEA5544783.1 ElyC/SanA/YdcF family protein [Limnoraphis robusta CCNP1324]